MFELQVAVAKANRYDSGESGDTVEAIERPQGGFSFVMADGQGTGRGTKTLSNLLTARAVSMLKDGARDGAVARAVHDYLYGYRHGQGSATLNILSVDFSEQRIIMSRNNPCPYFIISSAGTESHHEPSTPIGLYPNTKPVIVQHELRVGLYLIVFTDGIFQAGSRYDRAIDLVNYLGAIPCASYPPAQSIAEGILNRAIDLDAGQPSDDMSVLVLGVIPVEDEPVKIRRMLISFPMETTVFHDL